MSNKELQARITQLEAANNELRIQCEQVTAELQILKAKLKDK